MDVTVKDVVPPLSVTARELDLGDGLHEAHRFVLDYWEQLRGRKLGPSRQALNPLDLKSVLSGISLIEPFRVGGDRYRFRFRLAGTDVYGLNDKEITGCPTEILEPAGYPELLNEHYARMLAEKVPHAFKITFRTNWGKVRYYTALRVPLSGDGGTVDCIMSHLLLCSRWEDIYPFLK